MKYIFWKKTYDLFIFFVLDKLNFFLSHAILLYIFNGYRIFSLLNLSLQIQIWASNKIHRDERSFVGKWDSKSILSSSPQVHGPEILGREDEIPRHVKLQFRNPVRCRIIWLSVSLPQLDSGLTGLEDECNLLSFDDNFCLKPIPSSSFGNDPTSSRCIHAKRLIVFGKPVEKEIEQAISIEAPEVMKMKRLQERAPQLGRFRVSLLFLSWILTINYLYIRMGDPEIDSPEPVLFLADTHWNWKVDCQWPSAWAVLISYGTWISRLQTWCF